MEAARGLRKVSGAAGIVDARPGEPWAQRKGRYRFPQLSDTCLERKAARGVLPRLSVYEQPMLLPQLWQR